MLAKASYIDFIKLIHFPVIRLLILIQDDWIKPIQELRITYQTRRQRRRDTSPLDGRSIGPCEA